MKSDRQFTKILGPNRNKGVSHYYVKNSRPVIESSQSFALDK